MLEVNKRSAFDGYGARLVRTIEAEENGSSVGPLQAGWGGGFVRWSTWVEYMQVWSEYLHTPFQLGSL